MVLRPITRGPRAAAAGDPRYRAFYFAFPDREEPNRYAPYLRPMRPDRGGDAFNWHPELDGGAWVWSTISPNQWDLDYSNPGSPGGGCRRDAVPRQPRGRRHQGQRRQTFLWKQAGTDCENLPEAHVIVQVLETIARIAAPSISLISGAMVPDPLASFVSPRECRAGYDSVLMSAVWGALATEDTRLLGRALADRSHLPEGCAWITYLRSHDEIGWWFADEDALTLGIDPEAHRRYLSAFYRASWADSAARGQVAR